MDPQSGLIMNLANSIIGVSILAMPYCFHQCGIILSIGLLLVTSVLSRLTCHFLLKSALIVRRRTFEYLAFYIFGTLGKVFVEIGMIGFLIGSCIAFFVVMGDLGPAIVSEITGNPPTDSLRTSMLIAIGLLCVLPLGMLRDVDSLSGASRATIGFYFCLILRVLIEALPQMFEYEWVSKVSLWKPSGILQCIPIFAMALSCQTQLFEIYHLIPNASLEKMNHIIAMAVNICTAVYICVGLFGYIAFYYKPFTGNILLSFGPSATISAIKIGFILSLVFSFPLVIFPCRASLYSFIYKGGQTVHESASNYIPEGKFKALTLIIVTSSLTVGILIPNIEVVLGLVGSTIGVVICVLFPVTCFICVSQKKTNERYVAQIVLIIGVLIMVLSTYANLYMVENMKSNRMPDRAFDQKIRPDIKFKPNPDQKDAAVPKKPPLPVVSVKDNSRKKDKVINYKAKPDSEREVLMKESRHEPPQPEEPVDLPKIGNNLEANNPEAGNKKLPEKEVLIKESRQEPPQPEEPVDPPKIGNNFNPSNLEANNPEAANKKLPEKEVLIKKSRQEPPQPEEPVDSPKIGNNFNPSNLEGNNPETGNKKLPEAKLKPETEAEVVKESRHEPPQPEEPIEPSKIDNNINPSNLEGNNKNSETGSNKLPTKPPNFTHDIKEIVNLNRNIADEPKKPETKVEIMKDLNEIEKQIKDNIETVDALAKSNLIDEGVPEDAKAEEPAPGAEKETTVTTGRVSGKDEVDIEAIKKEETELKEQESEGRKKEQVLIETLQKQNRVQQELAETQKKMLEALQSQGNVDELKLKAVERIERIAKKAIEQISGGDKKKVNGTNSNNNKTGQDNQKRIKYNATQAVVNGAPLSYQLGLDKKFNQTSLTNGSKLNALPLPLIISQKLKNNSSSQLERDFNNNKPANLSLNLEKTPTESGRDIKSLVKNTTVSSSLIADSKDEVKIENDLNPEKKQENIGRDILESELLRKKREADSVNDRAINDDPNEKAVLEGKDSNEACFDAKFGLAGNANSQT